MVSSETMSAWAEALISSTAWSKAARLAFDGLLNPLSFLTNWSDAARISCSVAGGVKLKRVLMLLHTAVTSKSMQYVFCSAPRSLMQRYISGVVIYQPGVRECLTPSPRGAFDC